MGTSDLASLLVTADKGVNMGITGDKKGVNRWETGINRGKTGEQEVTRGLEAGGQVAGEFAKILRLQRLFFCASLPGGWPESWGEEICDTIPQHLARTLSPHT